MSERAAKHTNRLIGATSPYLLQHAHNPVDWFPWGEEALARDLDLEDVEFRRRPYSGVRAYAQSKQADRMLTWALARRLEGTAVTANAMHPGGVNTPLFAKGGGMLAMAVSVFSKVTGKTPEEGADTVVWLAASPEVEGKSSGFWIDRRPVRCRFRDPAAEERLWALCASMIRPAA